MADYAVIVSQLNFFLQIEIVLHHFEKHLDVPYLPVDSDNLLSGQINFGRQDSSQGSFVTMPDKNNFRTPDLGRKIVVVGCRITI